MKFYATFGVEHPFAHYTQPIEAPSYDTAREMMFSVFGKRWCMVYPKEKLSDLQRFASENLPLISYSLHSGE